MFCEWWSVFSDDFAVYLLPTTSVSLYLDASRLPRNPVSAFSAPAEAQSGALLAHVAAISNLEITRWVSIAKRRCEE